MKLFHDLDRPRTFRWLGSIAALALFLPALSAAQGLDLSNPDDVVKANRKIQASLVDGKLTISYFQGNVISRVVATHFARSRAS